MSTHHDLKNKVWCCQAQILYAWRKAELREEIKGGDKAEHRGPSQHVSGAQLSLALNEQTKGRPSVQGPRFMHVTSQNKYNWEPTRPVLI